MAAEKTTIDSSPTEILESVMLSIKNDDGFALPMKQSKLCLEMAFSLLESFRQRSPRNQAHSNWLVDQLNGIICKAKKRGSDMLNQERLWRTYHQLSISDTFQ